MYNYIYIVSFVISLMSNNWQVRFLRLAFAVLIYLAKTFKYIILQRYLSSWFPKHMRITEKDIYKKG